MGNRDEEFIIVPFKSLFEVYEIAHIYDRAGKVWSCIQSTKSKDELGQIVFIMIGRLNFWNLNFWKDLMLVNQKMHIVWLKRLNSSDTSLKRRNQPSSVVILHFNIDIIRIIFVMSDSLVNSICLIYQLSKKFGNYLVNICTFLYSSTSSNF